MDQHKWGKWITNFGFRFITIEQWWDSCAQIWLQKASCVDTFCFSHMQYVVAVKSCYFRGRSFDLMCCRIPIMFLALVQCSQEHWNVSHNCSFALSPPWSVRLVLVHVDRLAMLSEMASLGDSLMSNTFDHPCTYMCLVYFVDAFGMLTHTADWEAFGKHVFPWIPCFIGTFSWADYVLIIQSRLVLPKK